MIYLDYAATTPIREEALQVYTEVSKNYFGNPSSLHDSGSNANQLLELCRKELADKINGDPEGVYFTSGGSESNQLAIRSLLEAHKTKGNHLITSSTEHSSIHNVCKQLETEGFDVTYLPADKYGQVRLEDLISAITDKTILVSIQFVNPEIGIIQPIQEIGTYLHEHDILFHSDCVQAFGKVPIDVKQLHIDSLSISSHKIYGPKGVGASYICPSVMWKQQIPGTTHENGFRPGTVNVPGIASFITAAQLICSEMEVNTVKFQELRKRLIMGVETLGQTILVEGHEKYQLPHIVGLSVAGLQGQYVMLEFNRRGIAISTGSACQIGSQSPSRTMMAIGKSKDEAKQLIRLSFGHMTTNDDIDIAVDVLRSITQELYV